MTTTVINNGSTVVEPNNTMLVGDTIQVGSTTGVAAAVVFPGDSALTYAAPSLDPTSLIESLVPGQTTVEQSLLESQGTFVNQGTVEANGPAGSSFTLDVQQGTSGAPGYYFNYSTIEVVTGNTLTISIGPNAEFFNVGSVIANGGSLFITTSGPGAIAGGAAPVVGPVILENGGTVEDNTAFPAGVSGEFRTFVFADGANDLLKIDQIGSFSARIIGFEAGDTIDIGNVPFTSDSFDPTTNVLSIIDAGSTVASLVFVSGAFTTAGFDVTTSAGQTLIETTATNTVWNNTTGAWTTAANWSSGLVPGAADTARIGNGNTDTFTVTTGSGALSVGSLILDDPNATLQVSDSLTVAPQFLQQMAGTMEVTGTGTLIAHGFRQLSAATTLQLDPGAVMDVIGRPNPTFASNGIISIENGNTAGLHLMGTAVVDDAVLNASSSSAGTGGYLLIGDAGDGTPTAVTVEAGGSVSDTYSVLYSDPTSFGELTLTGAGTEWTDAGDPNDTQNTRGYMLVGNNSQASNTPVPPIAGAAQLVVENGATLTDVNYAEIANNDDSAGSATVTSDGVWNIGLVAGGYLVVGRLSPGTLDISDGGTVAVGAVGTFISNGTSYTGGGISIGNSVGATGTVTVSDGLLSSEAGIGVGNSGIGTLDVQSDGTVSITGHGIGIGVAAGASGTVSVSGSGALVTIGSTAAGIGVGEGGQGLLEVLAGGMVSLEGEGVGVATAIGAAGTVVVSGAGSEIIAQGTLGSSDGVGVGQGGQGVMTIAAGGLVAIDNGNGLDIGGVHGLPTADGIGTVAVQTGGTLNVTGTLFVWSGSTLSVDGNSAVDIGTSGSFDAGNVLIESGHTLIANGLVSAAVLNDGAIEASSSIASGQPSPGALEITGSVAGTGAIDIDRSAILKFDDSVAGTQTITFATGGAEMILGNPPGTFTAAIDNLNTGDRIEFGSGVVITGASVTSPGTVTVMTTTGSIVLNNVSFAAGANQSFFWFEDSNTGDWTIQVAQPVLNWTGSVGTDLGTAGDWSPPGPPNSSDGINFSNGGGTLTGSASALNFNISGAGTFDFNGATLTIAGQPSPPFPPFAGDFATDTVLNGATLNASDGATQIGSASGATVTAQAGSSVTTLGDIVGLNAGEPGSLVLTGAGTNWTEQRNVALEGNGFFTGYLTLGQNNGATGTLSVSNAATLTTQYGSSLGYLAGAQGSATVGPNGTWSLTGAPGLIVGRDGSGTATVDAGGTITLGGTFNAVGNNAGSTGTVTINAGGTLESTLAPQSNEFILNIGNEGTTGTLAASTGSVLVTGAGALLNLDGNPLAVGGVSNTSDGGSGSLTISNGGSVAVGTANSDIFGALVVGKAVSSTGIVTVTGIGSSLTAAGDAVIARGGSATLLVQNDAIVQIGTDPTGLSFLDIGAGSSTPGLPTGGTGIVSVTTGGTLTSAASTVVGGRGVTGTLDVNSSGTFIAETQMLVGTGGSVGGAGSGTVNIGAAGVLEIEGNGITAGAAALSLSTFAGSTATVNVSGAGASLTITGTMDIGVAGSADLTIGAGGVVSATAASVGAPGTLTLSGGTLDPATLTNSGAITGFGALDDALANNSTVIAESGQLDVSGAISGSGKLTIAADSTLNAAGTVAPSQSVTFDGTDATLILGTPGSQFTNTVDNLQDFDRVELAGISISGAIFTPGSIADVGTVTVTGSETYLFNDVTFAAGASTSFLVGHDAATGNDYLQVTCYREGTLILTERGEVAVEELREGDLVPTLASGLAPVVWIGHRRVDCRRHPKPRAVWPVRVAAGAFGPGRPLRELWLSPDHALYLEAVLIPVKYLIDGAMIAQVPEDEVTYYHVELPRHDVLLAEGLAAESYLDTGDRGNFANGGGVLALYPDFTTLRWEAEGYAPLVVTGAEVEAAKAMLAGGRRAA